MVKDQYKQLMVYTEEIKINLDHSLNKIYKYRHIKLNSLNNFLNINKMIMYRKDRYKQLIFCIVEEKTEENMEEVKFN